MLSKVWDDVKFYIFYCFEFGSLHINITQILWLEATSALRATCAASMVTMLALDGTLWYVERVGKAGNKVFICYATYRLDWGHQIMKKC